MNMTLRSIAIGLAATLGFAAQAQTQNLWDVSGTVSGCTPGQVITFTVVDNSNGNTLVTATASVSPGNCNYNVVLGPFAQGAFLTVNASTPCLGVIQTLSDTTAFNGVFNMTSYSVLNFNCGSSNVVDCNGVLNGPDMPGTPCTTPNGAVGTWSANCDCVINGGNTDCLGVVNGPNMPGTACITFFGTPGTWSSSCVCVPDSSNGNTDCMGIVNGPNVPGTACQSPATGIWGIWGPDCICTADSTNTGADCMGIANGPNLPGTPCWLFGTNYIGTWSANCECENSTGTGCAASFWAMQAYDTDSLNNPNGGGAPVPYEVWVWNLSSGVGGMTYLWSFGDGTSSTDPFPTHTYSGNGPYLLCLTINDATGCTDQFCDTISLDPDGILVGMMLNSEVNGNASRNGFTINILNPLTTSVNDVPALSEVRAWPNPATDDLYIGLDARFAGNAVVTILDVNGREVMQVNRSLNAGRNQQRLDVGSLAGGLYTVKVTDSTSGTSTSVRFAKTR